MSLSNRPFVYLAGPIFDAPESDEIRERIIRHIELETVGEMVVLNPADFETDDMTAHQVVLKDLTHIRMSDALFVYVIPGRETWGTPMEVFFAAKQCDIPVVAWVVEDGPVSKWLISNTVALEHDLDVAVDQLEQVLIHKL